MKTNRVGESSVNGRKFFLKGLILAAYIFIVASMLLIQPVSAQAIDRIGRGPSPEQIVSDLKEHLGLTAEQEAQILPIIKDDMNKRLEMRKKMRQLRESTDAKIEAILTEEQRKELQKLKDAERGRMRGGMHRRGPEGNAKPAPVDPEVNDDDDDL